MENGEKETIFSHFPSIQEKEFFSLKYDKEIHLFYPDEILFFINAIFTPKIIEFFKGRISPLSSLTNSKGFRKILVPCLDDQNMLLSILDKFQVVPAYEKHILMIPRLSPICKLVFDNSELHEGVDIKECQFDIVQITAKNFIVPLKSAYSHLYCESDISDVYTIARALLKFQLINGKCAQVFTAGNISNMVIGLMTEMRQQVGDSFFEQSGSQFDAMFIIDRSIDNCTPFLVQSTYGGMYDEVFNPDFNYIKLPGDVRFEKSPKEDVYVMTDNDSIYEEIKSYPSSEAIEYIQGLIKEGSDLITSIRQAQGTPQWGIISKRMAQLILLKPYYNLHFNLFQHFPLRNVSLRQFYQYQNMLLKGYQTSPNIIIDMINREQYTEALELLILTHVVSGVSQSLLEKVGIRLINNIGFDFLKDWVKLQNAGLIPQDVSFNPSISGIKNQFFSQKGPKFSTISELLHLLVTESGSESSTSSISHYYEGYIPITVKLVEEGIKNKWQTANISKFFSQCQIPWSISPSPKSKDNTIRKTPRNALVFIVGGATQTEFMMLNNLSELFFDKTTPTCNDFVGSTDIINSKRLLHNICPNLKRYTPTCLRPEEKQSKSIISSIKDHIPFLKKDKDDKDKAKEKAKQEKKEKEKKAKKEKKEKEKREKKEKKEKEKKEKEKKEKETQ